MPRYHNINGNQVQFTAEEETARDAEEQAWADGALARAQARLRVRRNQLLAETDFYGNSDVISQSDACKRLSLFNLNFANARAGAASAHACSSASLAVSSSAVNCTRFPFIL